MDEKKRIALWEEYARTKSSKIREKLILEYAGLVKIVAGRLGMYLGYTVEYDDLVGYGIFGLIDAIDKFELSKGMWLSSAHSQPTVPTVPSFCQIGRAHV